MCFSKTRRRKEQIVEISGIIHLMWPNQPLSFIVESTILGWNGWKYTQCDPAAKMPFVMRCWVSRLQVSTMCLPLWVPAIQGRLGLTHPALPFCDPGLLPLPGESESGEVHRAFVLLMTRIQGLLCRTMTPRGLRYSGISTGSDYCQWRMLISRTQAQCKVIKGHQDIWDVWQSLYMGIFWDSTIRATHFCIHCQILIHTNRIRKNVIRHQCFECQANISHMPHLIFSEVHTVRSIVKCIWKGTISVRALWVPSLETAQSSLVRRKTGAGSWLLAFWDFSPSVPMCHCLIMPGIPWKCSFAKPYWHWLNKHAAHLPWWPSRVRLDGLYTHFCEVPMFVRGTPHLHDQICCVYFFPWNFFGL